LRCDHFTHAYQHMHISILKHQKPCLYYSDCNIYYLFHKSTLSIDHSLCEAQTVPIWGFFVIQWHKLCN